jgi:hypothetical protein
MRGYATDFHLSQRHFCDTIAIEYEDDQIYVPVVVGGTVHRFCLDTGSSQGMTYRDTPISLWQDLGNVVSRDANGRKDTLRVVQLPNFSMGSLTLSGYVATIARRAPLRRQYDAILGFDLFNKGLCAKIDVQNRRMILTDNADAFAGEPGYTLHYQLKWFVPYLYVSPFMHHADEVLFDTGSRQLYTMNKQSFDTHAYKSKNVASQVEGRVKGHFAIGAHGVEGRDEVAFMHLNRLKWGKFRFTDVHAVTTQGTSRVGAQILQYGAVVINPFRRTLTFQPYEGGDSIRVANKQLEVAFTPRNGRAAVGLVFPEGEAYKAGLREGDVILRINDVAIPSFEYFMQHGLSKGHRNVITVFREKEGVREIVFVP